MECPGKVQGVYWVIKGNHLSESIFVCIHIHLHEPPKTNLRVSSLLLSVFQGYQDVSKFFCPLSHPEGTNLALDRCPTETYGSSIRQRWLRTDLTHPPACPQWILPCPKFYMGVSLRSSHLGSEYVTDWTLCLAPDRPLGSSVAHSGQLYVSRS